MEYNVKVFKKHRLIINTSGATGNEPVLLYKQISGTPGFRVLPYGKVFSNQYFGGAVNYEIPFYKGRFFTFTSTGFYELGGARNDNSDKVDFSHGPGGGFRVYLKKIALPAVGFDIAYNTTRKTSVFSLSIGFSH